MIPSVGRIVHYKLGEYDLTHLNDRMSNLSRHQEGQTVPMLITRVHAPEGQETETTSVNGRVFLDGQHDLWVTSRQQGSNAGSWSAPPSVGVAPAGATADAETKGALDELRGKIDALVTAQAAEPAPAPAESGEQAA